MIELTGAELYGGPRDGAVLPLPEAVVSKAHRPANGVVVPFAGDLPESFGLVSEAGNATIAGLRADLEAGALASTWVGKVPKGGWRYARYVLAVEPAEPDSEAIRVHINERGRLVYVFVGEQEVH